MKQTIDRDSRRGLVSARNEWVKKLSRDTWASGLGWDVNGFVEWMETDHGIKLTVIGEGKFHREFEITDEQKYMFYVLKYCS